MKKELSNEIVKCRDEVMKTVAKQTASIKRLNDEQETMKKDIKSLQKDQNDKEQRNRNYSIRIFNLPLPSNLSNNPIGTLNHVYNTIIQPILNIAVESKEIMEVPPVLQLLEFGHTLKYPTSSSSNSGKKTTIPPIIVRFFSRSFRLLVLKNKKSFLGKLKGPDKPAVFITEDLTSVNFRLMKELSEDKTRIEKCFSMNGQIKFILRQDPEKRIRTVAKVFDKIEDLN